MGEHFMFDGRHAALHVRRPLEARRRVPADVAPPAPPARPRGVPGRRLLPPLEAARARLQALRRARRRLADGAAGHRDAGRRHRRVHPDERDLDHRRPDLPRGRPLLLGRAPGGQRRPLGLARGRERPDEGDEEGRGPPAPRPLPVPRARGVRAVRLRARRGHAGRAARGERMVATLNQPQYAAVADGGAGGRDLRRHQRLPRRRPRRRTSRASRTSCASTLRTEGDDLQGDRRDAATSPTSSPRS